MATDIPVQDAERESITIQGLNFNVPAPYNAGHELRENEASALNQVYQENVRNNFTNKVKTKMKEEGVEKAEDLSKEVQQSLVQELEDYISDYDFGQRRGGGGGSSTPRDPVEAEAHKMARTMLKEALHKKGTNLKDYSKEQVDGMVEQVMTKKGDELREQARKVVEARKGATEDLDLDID